MATRNPQTGVFEVRFTRVKQRHEEKRHILARLEQLILELHQTTLHATPQQVSPPIHIAPATAPAPLQHQNPPKTHIKHAPQTPPFQQIPAAPLHHCTKQLLLNNEPAPLQPAAQPLNSTATTHQLPAPLPTATLPHTETSPNQQQNIHHTPAKPTSKAAESSPVLNPTPPSAPFFPMSPSAPPHSTKPAPPPIQCNTPQPAPPAASIQLRTTRTTSSQVAPAAAPQAEKFQHTPVQISIPLAHPEPPPAPPWKSKHSTAARAASSSTPSRNEATQMQQPHQFDTPPKHTPTPQVAPLPASIPLHGMNNYNEKIDFVLPPLTKNIHVLAKDIVRIMICPQPETRHKSQQHTRCLSSRDSFLTEVQPDPFIYKMMIKTGVILSAYNPEAIHLFFHAFGDILRNKIPPEPPPKPMNNSRTSFLEDGVNNAVIAGNNGKLGKGCSQAWKDGESMAAQV